MSRKRTEPLIEVLPTPEALYARASVVLSGAIRDALMALDRCAIALSRGPELIARLAEHDLDWSAVDIFQVDERAAPDGHPDRNLTAIQTAFEKRDARVHPMPVNGDLSDGARRYAAELESVCGPEGVLDVVHLGLGTDGHTASLIPGEPVVEEREAWVGVTGLVAGYRRMTLTLPVLDAATDGVFVVAGAEKKEVLAAVLAGDQTMPAAKVAAQHVRYLVDVAAAGRQTGL